MDGIGDRISEMQPLSMPAINSRMLGMRLAICEAYDLKKGGIELRWSQGEVVKISNGTNILKSGARSACYKTGEAVMMKWDANLACNEPTTTSAQ